MKFRKTLHRCKFFFLSPFFWHPHRNVKPAQVLLSALKSNLLGFVPALHAPGLKIAFMYLAFSTYASNVAYTKFFSFRLKKYRSLDLLRMEAVWEGF